MRTESTWAFIAGTSTGAVLGLLFARQSGKKTRRLLERKGREGLEEIASASQRVSSEVKDRVAAAKEQVSGAIGAAQDTYRKTVGA